MIKQGCALAAGDRLADRRTKSPRIWSEFVDGQLLQHEEPRGDLVPGGLIEDVRAPEALDHPMTVAVKIGGEWSELPCEAHFEIID